MFMFPTVTIGAALLLEQRTIRKRLNCRLAYVVLIAAAALLGGVAQVMAAPTGYSVQSDGDDQLYSIDLATGAATAIGPVGFGDVEALSLQPGTGVLFGVDDITDQLITINTATGAGTAVGPLGVSIVDMGLTFGLNGALYMATDIPADFYSVNPATGAATLIGAQGQLVTGLATSSGGTIYGLGGDGADNLVTMNTATGAATNVGPLSNVFLSDGGIDFAGGVLWGIEDAGTIFTIDTATGLATVVATTSFGFEGLAIVPEPGTLLLLLVGATILAIRAGVTRKLVYPFRKRLNQLGVVTAGTMALAAVFVLVASRPAYAAPVVINFESFPPGPFASHTESEVTFSAVGGGGAITTVGTPNLTLGLLDSNGPRKELRADIGPHATFVSVDLGDFDADADLLFLEVFNAADISLGFTSVLIDAEFTGMMTLSLAAADIAYAEFGAREPALNGNSVFADNFLFEPVPEPGTLFLFLVGATILAIRTGVTRIPVFPFGKRLNRAALAAAGTVALAAILVLVSSRGSVAAPVVIDFEAVPGGDLPSYTESGVTFDAIPASGVVTIDLSPGPNGTKGLLARDVPFTIYLPIRADIASGAISVSVDMGDFDGDQDDLFLRVYNSSDVLLDSDSITIAADFTGMKTLSTAAPGIAYAIFGGVGINGSSVFSDNFTFEVPEPGTLFLFLVGATILAIKVAAERKLVYRFRKRLNPIGMVTAGTVALAALVVLVSSRDSVAAPVVIDFESVPGGDLPSYTESGVTFDAIPASGTVTVDFSPGPNGTKGLLAEGADFLPIRADIAGGAISVSVDIGDFDGDQDDLFLRVYNSSDVLLDSDAITIAPDFTGMMTLSTAAPGIAYAIFGGVGLNSASNVYSDNFTFEVPEPGTLVLLLVGATILAIGAGLRRKPVFLFTSLGLGLAPGSASFKIVESIESEIASKHSQPVHTKSGQRRRIHLFCSMLYVALVAGLTAAPAYCDTIAVSFSSGPSQFISGLNRTRGWQFSTSTPIEVTALGLWDESADGFGTAHEVGIWNSSSVLLASATIPAGTSAPLVGPDDFRFVTLEATVDLSPGIYRIGAAYVDGDVDEIAWQAGPVGAPGFVTYVGPRLSPGDGFADPTDISAVTDGAFGPNFLFTPEPSSVVLAAFGLVGLTILASRAGIRRRER